MEEIEEILWNKTSDELTRLCKIAQIKGRSGYKEHKIELLCKFYSNENWVKEVFDNLSEYEKEIMTCIIQNKYHPEEEQILKILKKFKKNSYSYSSSYFDQDSKVDLFRIDKGYIPDQFKKKLDQLVEPLKLEIKPTKTPINEEDFYANIVGRDKRIQDFDEFIKFINVSKIKVTKAKKQMPKSSLLKIYSKLQYPDVLKDDEIEFEKIRSIEDTTVSYGIMSLLTQSLIINVKKDELIIEELFCEDYQKLNKVEKVKYLLEGYCKEDSIRINECERIEKKHFYIENKVPEFGKARKMILKYLKECPINEWIEMKDFKRIIRLNEYYFLRKYTGQVLIKDEYYGEYYQDASYEELENSFIDVVFMEYLATLGIVDVVMTKKYGYYDDSEFLEIEYFRLTQFGSYVLGMAKNDEIIESEEDEIVVTKNFEIIIGETNKKLEYELYFDRFLDKKSNMPLIYKLDFNGMAKALELRINFKEILKYLQLNCKGDIPTNVQAQFEDWIRDSKKIKIKKVTILEVDQTSFEQIIQNEKFENYIESIRDSVIVLKNSKIENVKEELKRNKKFCI